MADDGIAWRGVPKRTKSEFPKTETRKKSEMRNPNQVPIGQDATPPDKACFGFRDSGFGLLSAIGFRSSDFRAPALPPAAPIVPASKPVSLWLARLWSVPSAHASA